MELSICFVAPNAYTLLSGRRDISHIGGAEVQQVILARELLKRGYRVSFVTLDHGQPDGLRCGDITVYRAYDPRAGVPLVRFLHPRWTSLWSAMTRADADIYYHRGADCEAGQVALWCRCHRRPFVFASANDSDCTTSLPLLKSRRERVLYRVGLRWADAVVAQTTTQQRLLRENFGVESTVVPNCCPVSSDETAPERQSAADGHRRVIWVARFAEEKRLDWLLDVAERCPQIHFDVVGAGNTKSEYAARLTRRAAGMPNVVMHGQVPHKDMPRFYRQVALLCCTSLYEGFPNTFLEAWSRGLPVVSTFDPDGVIARHGIGWIAETVDEVVEDLKRALASPEALRAASAAAKRYCRENHSPEASAARLEQVLCAVVSGNSSSVLTGRKG